MSDVGHGRRVAVIAYTAPAVIMPLPTASLGSPWLAVIANALGALLMPLLAPALATATYNLATASPCPFRFQVATEAG
jgi:MFS transporter, DHA1 family, inner membrane transport protein